jgi:hypothetical protein
MPTRKGGLWLPLDTNFYDDPRIIRAGEKAATLYLAMCLACKRHGYDGRIERIQIERLHVPGWKARLDVLFREELVSDFDDGFVTIVSWLKHNDPHQKVQERRAADAARKRGESVPTPVGFQTDSRPGRDVEKRRVEKREVDVPAQRPVGSASSAPLRFVSSSLRERLEGQSA